MKRFKNLLVGLALNLEGDAVSAGSRRAALQAQWFAELTGASVTFLHSSWSDIHEEENAVRPGPGPAGHAALEEFVEEYASSGLKTELVHTDDRPWMEMIRRVLRGQNDLVVVARRNNAGSAVLGSTSRKLLRKCPCPVWVVKPDSKLLHGGILAATDLSPVGDAAVELAAGIAKGYGCPLHVVHAWQIPLEVQLSQESEEAQRARLAEIQSAAEAHIRAALERDAPRPGGRAARRTRRAVQGDPGGSRASGGRPPRHGDHLARRRGGPPDGQHRRAAARQGQGLDADDQAGRLRVAHQGGLTLAESPPRLVE